MMKPRPPIVTILGHVDHGKTTLLDALRKTNIVAKEAGGITQSIGASVVVAKEGRKITFIDTPGHAAFTQMRSRGAKVCDIAILIVASDDGVKPQTKEAIDIILKENMPFIVCLTKTDLPSSDPETVILQLEKEGIMFEGKGGNTPYQKVSAKKNEGLDALMEMIILVSDMNEISGDPDGDLDAFVVETRRDRRGSLASVIVLNGNLTVGKKILVDGVVTKVKALFDYLDKPIKEVLPGEPALILGFEKMPEIGAKIGELKGDILDVPKPKQMEQVVNKTDLGQEKFNLVIKAQTSGSLEALLANLSPDVHVISSGVGDIIEADIFTAKSAKNCRVFAFEVKVPSNISKLADNEGVITETFNVIYKLFERVGEILKEGEEEVLGKAHIIASFPYESRKVAGCKVVQGKIVKNDILILYRDDKMMGSAKAISMKKEKKDIMEVKQGEEFGVILQPQLDFTIGDMLVSVRR
jgi:translation initiation factor IF-2